MYNTGHDDVWCTEITCTNILSFSSFVERQGHSRPTLHSPIRGFAISSDGYFFCEKRENLQ